MTEKYYLLPILYHNFSVGTVLRFDGKKLTDLNKNNDHKFNECIPSDWIEIEKGEANYLSKIDIIKRIEYNEKKKYFCLSNLVAKDKCYLINEKGKRMCIVKNKTSKMDGIHYIVNIENGPTVTIPVHQIELFDENEIKNRLNNSTTINGPVDHPSKDQSCSSSYNINQAGNGQSCVTDVAYCQGDHNYDSINQGNMNEGDSQSICTTSYHNGTNLSGINDRVDSTYYSHHTSSSTIQDNNGRRNMNTVIDDKQYGCSQNNIDISPRDRKYDINNVTSMDKNYQEFCKNQQEAKLKGNCDGSNKFDIPKTIDCLVNPRCVNDNRNYKYSSNKQIANQISVREKHQISSKSQGSDNRSSRNYSYNSNSMINENNDPNNVKTIWCVRLNIYFIDPECVETIESHRRINKHLVYRREGKVYSIKAVWLGMVNRQPAIGCDIYFDHDNGINGCLKNKKLFNCRPKRGLLFRCQDFCGSDNGHNDLISNDAMSIKEDSICCIDNEYRRLQFPMKEVIIMKIGNLRAFVKCMWSGKINGHDAVGLQWDRPQSSGTDGKFCQASLFKCQMKMALLYESKNITYVPQIEFVRNIYLMKDYDISHIETDYNIIGIGKLMRVQDDPVIYGKACFGIAILGSFLMVLEINEVGFQDHEDLCDAFYYDSIIPQKYAIVVKIDHIVACTEPFKCIINNAIADTACDQVVKFYQSDQFKVGDTVTYRNGCNGNITEFIMLNCERYVRITNIMSNSIDCIREDEITKFTVNNLITDLLDSSNDIIRSESHENINSNVHISETNTESCNNNLVSHNENIQVQNTATCSNTCFDISDRATMRTTYHTVNNVSILKPENVVNVVKECSVDKMIVFKSKRKVIIARLLWIGQVNNEPCIGCEMSEGSIHGTDGRFRDSTLFVCAAGKGVLIPLHSIEDCCIDGSHKKTRKYPDGRIIGASICCAEQFSDDKEMKLGDSITKKSITNEHIFGILRWRGLVNNTGAYGVEMRQCCNVENDDCMKQLSLFDCPHGKSGLFSAEEIISDPIGLSYCSKNNEVFINPNNIHYVKEAELVKKLLIYKDNKKNVVLDVRWTGIVNGNKCIACQLGSKCECGIDGVFNGQRWFECDAKMGFLIPVLHHPKSCEYTGNHIEPDKYLYGSIKPDSVCCAEELNMIERWPTMRIGSKLRYRNNFPGTKKIGNCKWLGLINGMESIGANMKEETNYNAKGVFSYSKLFKSKKGAGVVFMSDDLELDIEDDKLCFLSDGIVDVRNLKKLNIIYNMVKTDLRIGAYVTTISGGYKGELKWMGVINGMECVGIDLECYCDFGMDGVIEGKHRFQCLPHHGIVTTMDNVITINERLSPTFTNYGIIDPDKYMICEMTKSEEYLRERDISLGGPVFVVVSESKTKAILRWCGTMNYKSVAVVQLFEDYDHGNDGRFWRHQLIQCPKKRAIAISWDHVFKYIPYKPMEIPEDKIIFPQISINSAVLHYVPVNNKLQDMYGTIKWSGIDECDQYLYGIELDDRYHGGTNGCFKGQQLFHCRDGYGVLVPIGEVAPDTRFIQKNVPEHEVTMSKASDDCQYAIPVRRFYGDNWGIQGNENSCYFDSSIYALFAKSDVLDFMISPRINENELNDTTKEFREIMASKIVFPLRQFGLVSFHRTNEMRDVIRRYGPKFEEMTMHETDMENVAALLANLCPGEELLRLTTFANPAKLSRNKGMFLQLFVTLNKRVPYISSQQMLDISMAQNNIMFEKPPTCLIMQAPRDARGINCYENVLPSRTIEISNLCYHSFKKCYKCDLVASWQCKICLEDSLHIKEALFCNNHKCSHDDILPIPNSDSPSKSEFQMQIKAIICIQRAHFVAYVKEDEFSNEWVFFDSMSTQNSGNNYSVPKVSAEWIVTKFLEQDEEQMKDQLIHHMPDELRRVVKDSYIFVYHNTALTCY